MHARPLALLTAMAAVTLVLAGCDEAILEATTLNKAGKPAYSAPGTLAPQPKLANMLLQAGAPPALAERPPDAGFVNAPARIQQATDQAAAAGATLSVAVLDRFTHQLVSNGNTQIPGIASVAKLFIADDLLLPNPRAGPRCRRRTVRRWMSCCSRPTTAPRRNSGARTAETPSSARSRTDTAWPRPRRPATAAGGTRSARPATWSATTTCCSTGPAACRRNGPG